MIVVYAEKEDMGLKFAAALGGIQYNGVLVNTEKLPKYQDEIKKKLANPKGYIETNYNGTHYTITWGWGHFGTLKDIKDYNPDYDKWYKIPLPFIPDKFEAKRRLNNNPDPERRAYFRKRDDRQFSIVKKLFNDPYCEYIINATDWEREGELIFAYVYELTGSNKPYYRLRNNAKTEAQIRKDFSSLVSEEENYPYVVAARGRSIADWVIGINLTIAGTMCLSADRSLLNIGRVLTPTLNIIVERENAIRNFVPKTTYGGSGTFTLPSGETYTGKLQLEEGFDKKEDAEKLIGNLSGKAVITSVKKDLQKSNPPLMYNTSQLQQEANAIYGFTLEETLKIAQSLYENGYTTYPRVDSQYLTEDKESEFPQLISDLLSMNRYSQYSGIATRKIPKRYYNDSKVEGHDAIIITGVIPAALTENEAKIYDMIARRMIMAACPPMETEKTTVITEADNGQDKAVFKTNGSVVLNRGFSELSLKKETSDTELPSSISENISVSAEYAVEESVSKPPKRFTEGTLVKAMETCANRVDDETAKKFLKQTKGIGRPSTRAAIVEQMISKGYVSRAKKNLVPTDKGMKAIQAITIDDIKSPVLTAEWEQELDEIESCGDKEKSVQLLRDFLSGIYDTTTEWCGEIKQHEVEKSWSVPGADPDLKCPVCGAPLRKGKHGWFCSGYSKGCRFLIGDTIAGKKISKATAKQLTKNGETSVMSGFISRSGKAFEARLVLQHAYRCTECGTYQGKRDRCYKCGGGLVPDDKMLVVGFEFPEKKTNKKSSYRKKSYNQKKKFV